MLDLKKIAYPLPEDVEIAKHSGCYTMADIIINRYLEDVNIPALLKDRLMLEKHNIECLKKAFPYTIEEAEELLLKAYPTSYKAGSLPQNLLNGNLAWIFIDGKMMVESRVVADAAKRLSDFVESEETKKDLTLRDENISYMKKHHKRIARIHIRTSIKPLTGFGEKAKINLPVVRPSHAISNIKFILASTGYMGVDAENILMRSAQFSKVLEEGDNFFIEYEYTITANYRNLEKGTSDIDKEKFSIYLEEELPHILFTPYLKDLAKTITEGINTPLEKARAIYNWITTKVKYSFMRPYKTIENIPEYAATNLKGDCGVQALLFITLCRIVGIPAKWQSGLYTTPTESSPHDWAEFYIPEFGWCFADCSFGGGAYRQGEKERWQYYFGSSDVFRTPCNDICCKTLTKKSHYPIDPTDNQRGEIELTTRSLAEDEVEWKTEVLEFEFLGEDIQ